MPTQQQVDAYVVKIQQAFSSVPFMANIPAIWKRW